MTENLDVISFLRDIGKHFSVNQMIQRDSVRQRLERADQGISYTEFSYMLLQGMDYLELAKRYECSLQIGDQIMGQYRLGHGASPPETAFALTLPLVTKADGSKFGKTASGTVWLSPKDIAILLLSVLVEYADGRRQLPALLFLPDKETIDGLAEDLAAQPEQRNAQRRLAEEITELVHGADAVVSAQRISEALFGGTPQDLQEDDLDRRRMACPAQFAIRAMVC